MQKYYMGIGAKKEVLMNNELECLLKEAFPDTVCENVSEFQEDGLTNQNSMKI